MIENKTKNAPHQALITELKSIVTKYLAIYNVCFSFYKNCGGTQTAMADFDNVADCCNNNIGGFDL